MYDLTSFSQSDATECGKVLRSLGSRAASLEDAANKMVHHIYDQLTIKPSAEKACVLVRFYKTHAYGELDRELQEFADDILGRPPT